MKRIILSLFLIFICSCSHDNPSPPYYSYNIDRAISIYLKDDAGNNLLNTTNYNSENFKIYYRLNGQTIEVYNPQMDAPRNFLINTETEPISMRLFMNDAASEPQPITYIKWNETDTDTLRTAYLRGEGFVQCSAVWLNDELAWDQSTPSEGTGRSITIVK